MSKSTINGRADISGESVGSIRLLSLSRTRPRNLYNAKCDLCNTSWSNHDPEDAMCRNRACGVEDTSRLSWRKQQEIEEKRELDATLAKTEREYQQLSNEVRKTQREAIQVWQDYEFILSQETRSQQFTKSIPNEQAAMDFSGAEADAFVRLHPEYLPSAHNHQQITNYLLKNGATEYVNREDLERAYFRLLELGLLETRPKAPQPEPPDEPVLGSVQGFSLRTKTRYVRTYSPEELAKMNSSDYKAAIVAYERETRPNVPEPQPTIDPDEVLWGHGKDGAPLALTRRQLEMLDANEYRRFLISAGESSGLRDADLILAKRGW